MPSAHNTSTGSAGTFTSKPNEGMKRGLQGNPGELDLKTFSPESEKWETPIRQEPGNWEKTPGRTAGLPGWSGVSGKVGQDSYRKLSSKLSPKEFAKKICEWMGTAGGNERPVHHNMKGNSAERPRVSPRTHGEA